MTDERSGRPRFCSQCGMPVVVTDAAYCKECGAPLTGNVWVREGLKGRSGQAAALSLLPGLGQWSRGQRVRGLVWFLFVGLMYLSSWPLGLLAHVICLLNASLGGTRPGQRLGTRYIRPRRHSWKRGRRRSPGQGQPSPAAARPGG